MWKAIDFHYFAWVSIILLTSPPAERKNWMLHNSDQIGELKPTKTKGLFVLDREKAHKSLWFSHVNFAFILSAFWTDPRHL